jgi:uncharacterized protein YdaU (DUF1376 family)
VNFYPHHIGDFNNATRHLTRIERSIYRDMIELYYDTENPLVSDIALLCRKLLARTEDEINAVKNLLIEFFEESPEGWFHTRCAEEIEKASERMCEANDKRENENERQRRHRQIRKELFETLRGFGETPAWNVSTDFLQSRIDHHRSRTSNVPVTVTAVTVTDLSTANHKPLTINQIPISIKNKTAKPTPLPDWLPEDVWQDWKDHRIANKSKMTTKSEQLCIAAFEKAKVDGHTPRQVVDHCIQNGWKGIYPPRAPQTAGKAIDGNLSKQNYRKGMSHDGRF